MAYFFYGGKCSLKTEMDRPKFGLTRKRKLCLAVILVTLVITGSSFAYTYLTAIQTISVTGAGADIVTVEYYGSPSWGTMAGRQAGTLPVTSLFKITPLADYTGDLLVTVYLTNAGELIYCYQHLNMKISIYDKDGTRVVPFEFITLENGKARFGMSYGSGWNSPYYVNIIGGSYNTLKGTAGSGESFSPSFYCEVSQR